MSKSITGDVQYVGERNGYYSIKLDNGKWYGFGDEEPTCEKGDRVKFSYDVNKKNGRTFYNADAETLKCKKGAGKVLPYKKKGGSGGGGGNYKSRDDYYTWRKQFDIERAEEIAYAGSRNAALAFMGLLAGANALPIAKLKTPAKIQEALEGLLNGLTDEFLAALPGKAEAKSAKSKAPADDDDVEETEDEDFDENEDEDFEEEDDD